jgi:hypothetical protein
LASISHYEPGNGKIMKKNKNIFLHIIEEDYREKSQKQVKNFDVAEKGVLFTDIKNESFVFKQLEKLHDPFITIMDSELNLPNLEIKELEHQNVFETMRSIDDLELNDSFQAIKTQQKEHKRITEGGTSKEQVLHDRLSAEISEKKKAIETLQLQILSLQNSCRELSRELSNNN